MIICIVTFMLIVPMVYVDSSYMVFNFTGLMGNMKNFRGKCGDNSRSSKSMEICGINSL